MTLAEKIKLGSEWQYERGDRSITVCLVLTRAEYEAAVAARVERSPATEKDGSYAIALHSDGTSTDMNAPYCKDCGSNDIQQLEGALTTNRCGANSAEEQVNVAPGVARPDALREAAITLLDSATYTVDGIKSAPGRMFDALRNALHDEPPKMERQLDYALGLLASLREETTPVLGETGALCRAIDDFIESGEVPVNVKLEGASEERKP